MDTTIINKDKLDIHREQFYKCILENSDEVFAVTDINLITLYKSKSVTRIFGYEPEELVGQNGLALIHPDDHSSAGIAMEESINNPNVPVSFEMRYLHKTKGYRMVEGTATNALDNPFIRGFIMNYRDVTEKHKMTKALVDSREHLDLALKGAELGIWDWDLINNKLYYNKRWASILDYELEEVEGVEEFWEKNIHPDDYKSVVDALYKHINGKSEYYETEHRLKSKRGEWKWILDRGRVLERDAKGKAIRAAGTHLDITERKLAEDRISQKTQELTQINNELEQFAYIASHNLRAPVVNLSGLMDHYDRSQTNKKENSFIIEKIDQSIQQLQSTLDDLIDIVALNKEIQDQIKEYYFEDILNSVQASISAQIEKINMHIQYNFSEVQMINYPKSHLDSIFLNLLTNSIKYKFEDQDLIVRLKTKKQSGFTVVVFEDNGSGMDLKTYGDKVFKMHQRFHLGKTGKGLGLYIIKKQVEQMGGEISVSSELGKGTKFKIFLKDQTNN